MERLDFASVMAVLGRNVPDEDFGNQRDFRDSLFIDVNLNPYVAVEFDQGQVCPMKATRPGSSGLHKDTLLIVDNFHVTASRDQYPNAVLKYRCRILFTARSGYEKHISPEVRITLIHTVAYKI